MTTVKARCESKVSVVCVRACVRVCVIHVLPPLSMTYSVMYNHDVNTLHKCIYKHTHTHTYTYIHTYTCSLARAHMHTHDHMRAHKHTRMLTYAPCVSAVVGIAIRTRGPTGQDSTVSADTSTGGVVREGERTGEGEGIGEVGV